MLRVGFYVQGVGCVQAIPPGITRRDSPLGVQHGQPNEAHVPPGARERRGERLLSIGQLEADVLIKRMVQGRGLLYNGNALGDGWAASRLKHRD
jgi:hypothetical protein